MFIQKLYKVFGFTSRQRRNRSKKVEEREETMGFSAMDETLIKSRCLLICNNLNLNYITHADVNQRIDKTFDKLQVREIQLRPAPKMKF